jgi:hypothetical protein
MFDKDTLELGPFLWLGGAPASPCRNSKLGRHTKGDKDGFNEEPRR